MEEVNALNGKNLILDKLLDGSGFVKVVKVFWNSSTFIALSKNIEARILKYEMGPKWVSRKILKLASN